MSQEVCEDWEQREFIASMEDALVKIVDFLNRFDKSCRYKLANVNAKLSSLERKLDYVQHCLNQANPADRGGVLTPIANTPFDLKWQVEQISKRKQNRDQRMRTQLPVLAEQNTELKGLLTLDRARHNEEQKKREVVEHQKQQADRQARERAEQQRRLEEQAKQAAVKPAATVASPENRPVPEVPPQREQKKSVAKQQPPAPVPVISRPSLDGHPSPPPSNRPPPVVSQPEMPKPPANRGGPPQPPGGPPQPPGGPPQPPGGPPQPPPSGNSGPPQPPGGPPQHPGGNPPAPPSGPNVPGHQMALPPHWATGDNVQLEWIDKGDESQSPAMDGETCIIKYLGYLANGECFDEAPENFEFVVGENIEGLEDAVKQMSPGASAKVWIPSPLGYGDEWAGDMIPPNSDLTFDLQVIRILGNRVYLQ